MPSLSINGQTRQFAGDSVSVGRGAENTISLPTDGRLAPTHAVLKLVSGRWIVEAQSGSLIRVGNGRPAQFAWINPGDVIHLTESGPQLVFEPGTAPANPAGPAAPTPMSASLGGVGRWEGKEGGRVHSAAGPVPPIAATNVRLGGAQPNWRLYSIAGGLAVLVLVGLGLLFSGRNGSSPENAPDEIAANAAADAQADSSESGAAVAPDDPRQALYRLELQTADGKRTVQLGTAWAIGPRRLVTTGDAARGIALNQEFYPKAIARHSLTREPFEISGMTLHPQYETAAVRLDAAVRRIEKLKFEYEQSKVPAEQRQLEEQLHKQDDLAVGAADEAVNVNVAILDVGKDLTGALPWSGTPGAAAKVGQKLTLVGHPLPLGREDFLVDPDSPVLPQQRNGRLKHTTSGSDSNAPVHWLVGFDDPLKQQNWSGSPVLDSKGVAVGIYIRPTPPPPGTNSGTIVTHDVSVLESLRALMPGGAAAR